MRLRKHINTPALYSLLLTASFITGCETPSSGSSSGTGTSSSSSGGSTAMSIEDLLKEVDVSIFTFNGFDANEATYTGDTGNPIHLAGDLSATDNQNLYLTALYKDALNKQNLGTYDITLPASKAALRPSTILNPNLSMANTTNTLITKYKDKLTPSKTNPVILTVPKGRSSNPETPFFSAGTRYTAVTPEVAANDNETARFSFQGGADPISLGFFGHRRDTNLHMRVYTNDSKVVTENLPGGGSILALSTPQPGNNSATIKARYLSLTSDGINTRFLELDSLSNNELENLGWDSRILGITRSFLPEVVTLRPDPAKPSGYTASLNFHNGSFNPGIFCLGGDNLFGQVTLSNETFIFPVSAAEKNTRIDRVNASEDSGFIATPKKKINVTQLNANGNLNVIANLRDTTQPAAGDDPVVQVIDARNLNQITVRLALSDSNYTLPAHGFKLLSYENGPLNAPAVANITPVNVGATIIGGTAALEGNTLKLTTLTKRPAAGLSGAVAGLMAHHPGTQGMAVADFQQLLNRLTPMPALSSIKQNFAATSLNQLLTQNLTHQGYSQQLNHLQFSGSNGIDKTVNASMGYATNLGSAVLLSQAQASMQQGSDHREMDLSLTALRPVQIDSTTRITPAISIGYAMNRFDTIRDAAGSFQLTYTDVASHSAFIQTLAAVDYQLDTTKFNIGAGIDARFSSFSNGEVSSNGKGISLEQTTHSTISSIIQAGFETSTMNANVSLWNFKTLQFNVSINY